MTDSKSHYFVAPSGIMGLGNNQLRILGTLGKKTRALIRDGSRIRHQNPLIPPGEATCVEFLAFQNKQTNK